jgi:hypothetical protein
MKNQQEEKYLTHEEILEIGQQREEANRILDENQNEDSE